MKYKVILPFSHKFNGVRNEASVGDIISDKEINPIILKYVLENNKVKFLGNKKEKIVKKQNVTGKKKVKRMSGEKSEIVEETEVKPEVGLVDLNKESLEKMSKSQLKRVATQLGLGIFGSERILVTRILKSGI